MVERKELVVLVRENIMVNNILSVKEKVVRVPEKKTTLPIDVVEEEIDIRFCKKIQPIIVPDVLEVAPECNVIMNTSRLEFFQKLLRCPECNDNVIITHEIKLKYGLAHFFKAKCCSEICERTDSLLT